MKERVGDGGGDAQPNPKPLHNVEEGGGHVVAEHLKDLQRQAFRGEPQPFHPNPAELNKANEQLGQQPLGLSPEAYVVFPGELASPRSPPENPENQGEQEVNSMLPSYIRRWDSSDRELVSYKLVPDKELLKEMGWDNFAELVLDLSSYFPKPEDPALTKDDYKTRREEQWLSDRLTADEWEKTIVDNLEGLGSRHLIPQFKQDMQEYRKAVKAIVRMWRESRLL